MRFLRRLEIMGNVVEGMSKIATLITPKGQYLRISIRERKGKHGAPYLVAEQQDGMNVHIRLQENDKKDFDVYDNDGVTSDNIKYIKKWMKAYHEELLESWEAAKEGKAVAVPSILPKRKSTGMFKVKRIKELRTNKNLFMAIRFEDNEIRIVDFRDVIPFNTAFAKLKNPKIFMQAEAQNSAVRWEILDVDIEAADLYEISHPVDIDDLKLKKGAV